MGKKLKGGRKQILQLEEKKPPKNDSEQSSSIAHSSKDICPLDTQVADFFKEIDALTVNEESIYANKNVLSVQSELKNEEKSSSTVERISKNNLEDEPLERIKPYCAWQEIPDKSTGYSYYWNVETNEVTWDCPDEYAAYFASINNTNTNLNRHNDQNMSESLETLQKKRTSQLKEGSIIPVSFFGESSSSEESIDGITKKKKSQLKPKNTEKITSGSKSKANKSWIDQSALNENSQISNIIGPQLPPDFHFLQNIPLTVSETESSSKNECDSYSETDILCENNLPDTQEANFRIQSDSLLNLSTTTSSQPNLSVDSVELTSHRKYEKEISQSNSDINGTEKENGEESPDSTVKQTNYLKGSVPGSRLVVEYDSFTDEEEDIVSSNVSFSNDSIIVNEEKCIEKKTEDIETKSYKEVSVLRNGNLLGKRKSSDNSNLESFDCHEENKKIRTHDAVDIDSLFASHASNQKHGFGFRHQEPEYVESEASCSYVNNDYKPISEKNDYKIVSFVKSKHILNLNELNSVSSYDNIEDPLMDNVRSNESRLSKMTTEYIENIIPYNEEKQISDEESNQLPVLEGFLDQNTETSAKENVSQDLTYQADFEEDIDEIDKALCEALEAKKALERSSSTSVLPNENESGRRARKLSRKIILEMLFLKNQANSQPDPTRELNRDNILGLATNLIDKLTFLISSHSTFIFLSSLLVQLQTRFADWQASALNSSYFMARLLEVDQYMNQLEMGIVSGDWICQWDRENKRYYFTNTRTQHSQWTYPEELCVTPESSYMESQSDIPTSSASTFLSEHDEIPTVSSSIPETSSPKSDSQSHENNKKEYHASTSNSHQSSPPPLGVDFTHPPPPCSPLPPPPDSTDAICDLSEDMDLENSNDSCSQPIIYNSVIYEANHLQYPSVIVSSSNNSLMNNNVDTTVSNVTSTLRTYCGEFSGISGTAQTFYVNSRSYNNNTHVNLPTSQSSLLPIIASDIKPSTSSSIPICSQSSDVSDPCQSSSSGIHYGPSYPCSSNDVTSRVSASTQGSVAKKKKMKLAVLALKKKNIPSLVEKWQKIREQEEED